MQIKEQGKKIVLIRTEYRKETKRTHPITIGRFEKQLPSAPDEIWLQLDENECEQLTNWLASRDQASYQAGLQGSLEIIKYTTKKAAQCITDEQTEEWAEQWLTEDKAGAIYAAIDELTKCLRKKGYTRKKKEGDSHKQGELL